MTTGYSAQEIGAKLKNYGILIDFIRGWMRDGNIPVNELDEVFNFLRIELAKYRFVAKSGREELLVQLGESGCIFLQVNDNYRIGSSISIPKEEIDNLVAALQTLKAKAE